MASKLILTGFMATGKSAVGEAIARRLRWKFIDIDRDIAARAGKSIAAIFAEDGEAQFRASEREAIARLADDDAPAVAAAGGGAIVDQANYGVMARHGVIVCLSARPEVIAKRIERSGESRPKLLEGNKPLRMGISELLAQRKEAYARAAVEVDTSDLTIEEAADAVIAALERRGELKCRPSA